MKKIICILACLFTVHTKAAQTPVVLISIDGFSSEYLSTHKPTNLLKLLENGLSASSLTPVFPTKTFPNHLSIVTGKYPVEHGIIGNSFYRKDKKIKYSMGDGRFDSTWLKAEPIWISAEKNGIKSASYFWPESTTVVDGVKQTYSYPYDESTSNKARLDQILDWLQLPDDEKPGLITGYFSLVDTASHNFGVSAAETKHAVKEIDRLMGQFISSLEQKNIEINLIIVSDHGMINIESNDAIAIKSFHELQNLDYVSNSSTQLYLYEDDKQLVDQVIISLNNKAKGRYRAYKNGQYPSHWHFNTINERVPDIIVNANIPFTFTYNHHSSRATHGYDPMGVTEMGGIFISHGPNIKQGKLDAFENRYVHQFIAELLALPNIKAEKPYPLKSYVIK